MTGTFLAFFAGLFLLLVGAEALVRGAVRVAGDLGISPLVVGLTVVAFGTSAPELAVSLNGALSGTAGVAVGNVVGSNIFNVLFILGLSALVAPLVVAQRLVRVDVPLVIGASLLMLGLGLDGAFGRWDGALLFAGIVAYTVWAIRSGTGEPAEVVAEYAGAFGRKGRLVLWSSVGIAGLGLLAWGSDLMVDSAVAFARRVGMSDLVVGLTIVSAGTSLPEVATSVVASARGQRDIAVGNVVGSNLFNLLAVLGLTALVSPEALPVPASAMAFDLPVMVAVAVAALPVVFTGHRIDRWEGALFLAWYAAYLAYVVIRAVAPAHLGPLGLGLGVFVGGLTALTLAVWFVRSRRPAG